MIDEIRRKGALLLLLLRQVPRELVDDRADHLQMPELLRADIRQQAALLVKRHGIALGQIPKRRAKLAVRAAVLRDDDARELRVRVFDPHRILQLLFIDKHRQPSPSFAAYCHGHGPRSQS